MAGAPRGLRRTPSQAQDIPEPPPRRTTRRSAAQEAAATAAPSVDASAAAPAMAGKARGRQRARGRAADAAEREVRGQAWLCSTEMLHLEFPSAIEPTYVTS